MDDRVVERYSREVRSLVRQLVDEHDAERVLLFGSCARGELHEDSDVDLLVVKRTQLRWIDRIAEVLPRLRSEVPVDIVIYTPEEFEARATSDDPVFRSILAEAQVLHDGQRS